MQYFFGDSIFFIKSMSYSILAPDHGCGGDKMFLTDVLRFPTYWHVRCTADPEQITQKEAKEMFSEWSRLLHPAQRSTQETIGGTFFWADWGHFSASFPSDSCGVWTFWGVRGWTKQAHRTCFRGLCMNTEVQTEHRNQNYK